MQKYIGDAVMAPWVDSIRRREHAETVQALRALSEARLKGFDAPRQVRTVSLEELAASMNMAG